ncbi:hypothetical protein K493DRAFT_252230 [Basidiobolus meristosporus CBS 931.73]|uniref:ATP synthase subunit H, mitochondrial n=1 Tax=Basidiobolus meristosporus CBS 931.73 TaxID=1314790 RepID=A0A1Y1Z775_9FUNG|nr:hypothetical protein K493DRAFT_252230 [Basidiobolus meristosporus CBS 931.73]|eukprot:ORY06103.1 hypothetical protein K493DRAFT_252230 [Basidiobolus meristosporus CBS 931.73]
MYALATASLRTPLATATFARGFSSQAVQMKDVVQELYLKNLKSYKPSPQAAGSEAGQVKDLKLPAAPEVPKINEDIAAELAAYDSEVPSQN